ncbi:uncharacterized protein [Palaemon carinicauda]|uniref:uncharacterized protein n=1 Tax=Palaemon carinicauda TaxID=392227 RepID=UPI0035B6739E
MERRELPAEGESNEGYAPLDEVPNPPDEVSNPPGEERQANDGATYAQENFPVIYEYEEAGPSAPPAGAGPHEFDRDSTIYDTDIDDFSDSYDYDPEALFPEVELHQEGATCSNEGERTPPTGSSIVPYRCRRPFPKSEGSMTAHILRLRRERDRLKYAINEQTAILNSLYAMLQMTSEIEPELETTMFIDPLKIYNVDPNLGVDNKLRYFSVTLRNSIFFLQETGNRMTFASGFAFDGVSLTRVPDVPATSGNPVRIRDFSEGRFTVGRSASVDSLPALVDPAGAFANSIVSPIEDNASNEDSSQNNQMESGSGNPSNRDSSTNDNLGRSTSNQDSNTSNQVVVSGSNQDSSNSSQLGQSGSNRDFGNSNQLQSSTTDQDSNTNTDSYAIPTPLNRNVHFTRAENLSSEEQSLASNSQNNDNTIYSLDPGPSGNNQNRNQEMGNTYSDTGNVGTSDRVAVSQYVGSVPVASPTVPIAMHSNQNFYNTAAGTFYAVASTGQNTVSSNSATYYSDSTISSANVNTATSGYVPVPSEFYAPGETTVRSANIPVQSSVHPAHNSGGSYIVNDGYSGAQGNRNTAINIYPAPVSRTMNTNVGVQGFVPMNVVTQTTVPSTVYYNSTQGLQAINYSQPILNTPQVYYPLTAPVLHNVRSYASGSSNVYPRRPIPIYGYNQSMNSSTVVLNRPPSAFNNFIPPAIQSLPGNMIEVNTPRGVRYVFAPRVVPYLTGNVIPYASPGMYNIVNVRNNLMPVYNPNPWPNSLLFDARHSSAYLPPGNNTYGVQGNTPQIINPSQELDQEDSSPENIDVGGSARTRGFINAIPQTSDPQSDNPNDSTAEACASEGVSVQTSPSNSGKAKKSTQKGTHESSSRGASYTNQPGMGRDKEVRNFQECASEQFPEVITSGEGSQSNIHESSDWHKYWSRSSGEMATTVSTSEGESLRNSDINTSLTSAHGRKKNKDKVSLGPHFGIQTRSKTRELLIRKETENRNLSERTMGADGAAASATSIDEEDFAPRTRHRSKRGRRKKRKSSAGGRNRDMSGSSLSEVITDTRAEYNYAAATSEAGISEVELEAPSSGPLAAPVDTRISGAAVGDVSGTVEDHTLGMTGTASSVALSSRNRRKTIGPIKNRPSKPQYVNEDSKVPSQPSSPGLSNQSEIVESETSELASGISLGASADGDIKDESDAEDTSDTPSTSWNVIGMRSEQGVRSKRKVSEKSYHSISRSSKRTGFSEATASGGDLQSSDEIKGETDDPVEEAVAPIEELDVMPSTSSGRSASGAIPKKTLVKPKPIITETDTTSKLFKALTTENVMERETSSNSILHRRLTIPQINIHRPATPESQPGTSESQPGTSESQPGTSESQPNTSESQPGTSESQPGTSDQLSRSLMEYRLARIRRIEEILTGYRNQLNNVLDELTLIDDVIIEGSLVEEVQRLEEESPRR